MSGTEAPQPATLGLRDRVRRAERSGWSLSQGAMRYSRSGASRLASVSTRVDSSASRPLPSCAASWRGAKGSVSVADSTIRSMPKPGLAALCAARAEMTSVGS